MTTPTAEELKQIGEQVNKKIEAEERYLLKKIRALKDLGSKSLIESIKKLEDNFEAAQKEEALFRRDKAGLISSTGDCVEVKRILAELSVQDTQDMKVADREAWLILQRKDNKELSEAIKAQRNATFELENIKINVEMCKKRLESAKAFLALRTAQIQFLTDR